MKLIKIEEVINGRTISRITDKSNDNGVNTESSIPSNIKGEDTKEKNEITVVEVFKKPKRKENAVADGKKYFCYLKNRSNQREKTTLSRLPPELYLN